MSNFEFGFKLKFGVKVKFGVMDKFGVKVVVKVNVCVVASGFARWLMSVCVWLQEAVRWQSRL